MAIVIVGGASEASVSQRRVISGSSTGTRQSAWVRSQSPKSQDIVAKIRLHAVVVVIFGGFRSVKVELGFQNTEENAIR